MIRSRASWLVAVVFAACAQAPEGTQPSTPRPTAPSIAAAATASSATPASALSGPPPSAPPPSTASSPPPAAQVGRPRGAPANASQAIAHFRAAWVEEVGPGAGSESRRKLIDGWNETIAKQPLQARRMACAEAVARAQDTLGPAERELVLFSSLETGQGAGECWEIAVVRGFQSILGYIDAKTGALRFAWLVPEG